MTSPPRGNRTYTLTLSIHTVTPQEKLVLLTAAAINGHYPRTVAPQSRYRSCHPVRHGHLLRPRSTGRPRCVRCEPSCMLTDPDGKETERVCLAGDQSPSTMLASARRRTCQLAKASNVAGAATCPGHRHARCPAASLTMTTTASPAPRTANTVSTAPPPLNTNRRSRARNVRG